MFWHVGLSISPRGRPIMVSHGLPGGLVGSGTYLYRTIGSPCGCSVSVFCWLAFVRPSGVQDGVFFVFRERMCFTRDIQVQSLWVFSG